MQICNTDIVADKAGNEKILLTCCWEEENWTLNASELVWTKKKWGKEKTQDESISQSWQLVMKGRLQKRHYANNDKTQLNTYEQEKKEGKNKHRRNQSVDHDSLLWGGLQ